MKKQLVHLALFSVSLSLVACTTWEQNVVSKSDNPSLQGVSGSEQAKDVPKPPETLVTSSAETGERGVGGSIENSMDVSDRTKMSHALDKAPGRPTQWMNETTGVTYTVVPIRKVTINDNPYCRTYTLTAARENNTREVNGTACVAADGSWQAIGS